MNRDYDNSNNLSFEFSNSDTMDFQEAEELGERTYSHADLQAFNFLDCPIWIFDIVRRSMWYANDAALALWSAKDLQSLLDRDFRSDMSEATASRLDDYLLQFSNPGPDGAAVAIKDRWTFYPNFGKDGAKTVDCIFKGIPIEEGRVAMLSQAFYVEEPNTKSEKEALRSVEMLRHLPVAVCLTDLDGHVIDQNPEAVSIFGHEEKSSGMQANDSHQEKKKSGRKLESTFVKRFVDKKLGRRVLEGIKKSIEDKTSSTNGDQENITRLEAVQNTVHGERWSAIEVRHTQDPVTSKPALLYSCRDITAVVEAKRQATAADHAKKDLLADMAHAVRTPLQHVVGVVELISRQQGYSQERRGRDSNYSSLLQSAAQLLMNVIHDLMGNVAESGGSGKSPLPNCSLSNRPLLEYSGIDVERIVKSTIDTVAPHAEAKGLELRLEMNDGDICPLSGDGNRLTQVLFELLHNAVKFTSYGQITVRLQMLEPPTTRRKRTTVRFEVSDTGAGLNLEQQRQCMTRRESPEDWKDIPDNAPGRGNSTANVGLTLCSSLVEAMGGVMGVESKPGEGSTFWFELPFLCTASSSYSGSMPSVAETPCEEPKWASFSPAPEQGGVKILLTDDDSVARKVTTALLKQSGCSVTTANSATEMLAALSDSASFDVVLLEPQLSSNRDEMSPMDAVREVRNRLGYSTERLPILAVSSDLPRSDYAEIGLNNWLTKPVLMKDVKIAMTNAICNVGSNPVSSHMSASKPIVGGLGVSSTMGRNMHLNSPGSAFRNKLHAVMCSPVSTKSAVKVQGSIKSSETKSTASESTSEQKRTDAPPRMVRRVYSSSSRSR